MYDALRSILIWFGISFITLLYFPLDLLTCILALPFDRRRWVGHLWAMLWGRTAMRLNSAWSCTVDARRLPSGRHFVIIANHESMADIMVAYHLNHNFKWIAKDIVFKVPFMGWAMYFAGYLPLRRGDRESVKRCMDKAKRWLEKDTSVLFFPEGTRSLDGQVKPFKPGAFRLALETGVDILPIAITGTADTLPKHSWKYSREKRHMKALVGDPISVKGLTEEDLPALMERGRDAIIALKEQLDGVVRQPERRAVAI